MASYRETSRPFKISQNAQSTYKLYYKMIVQLARKKLEEELRDFPEQTYKEVHGVLYSSFPTTWFKDATKIVKLSALLKNHKADHRSFDGVSFNYFQPLRAVLSHQQPKVSLHSLRSLVQLDGSKSSISSNTPLTKNVLRLKPKECVSENKNKDVPIPIPPAIIQNNVINEGKSKAPRPSVQRSPESPVIWGCGDGVLVQHQKQTSSQLLCFLKENAKAKGSLKVTLLEKTKYRANDSSSPLRTSPTVKTKSYHFRHVVTDDPADIRAPKTLHADVTQAPVFRVKGSHSCCSLIYSFVIASETELWDVGDVFTEVLLEKSVRVTLESRTKCQKAFCPVESLCDKEKLKPLALPCVHPLVKSRIESGDVKIPDFEIRKFEEAEVVVSHVVSPGHFYIQHADSTKKLEAHFTDLKVSHSCAEQNCLPDIGAQVICWHPQHEQWCRTLVVRISGVSRDESARKSSITVEVKRLDYGDSFCASLSNIRPLSSEMALLPLQALQVSLVHVMPVNGTDWTEEAVSWFKAIVHDRTLYARLYPQGPAVTAELFLEKGKLGAMRRGESLSLRLAHNGHAKHSKLKNNTLSKKSAAQCKLREQKSDWEKYLISCYTQKKI